LNKVLLLLFPLVLLFSAAAGAEEKTASEKKYVAEVLDATSPGFMYVNDEAAPDTLYVSDEQGFKAVVLDSKYPVFVFFWAPWNGSSRMVMPVIQSLARKYKGRMKFVQVNADEAPLSSEEYGIAQLPTMVVFKNGKVTGQLIGAVPEKAITSFINTQLR